MAATLKCDTIQNAGSATVNLSLDTTGGVATTGTLVMGSSFKRNKLINGDMGVYQRGSVAATTAGAYTLDRWFVTPTGATVTVTQSTTVIPTGFADSLNVASAASVTNVAVYQRIESVNTQDLASGVQVTVSGRIYQSTGSAVTTATIALAAPTALDNYTSTTSAATTYTLPSIANATWTTFSNTFTLTTSCVNGLQVTIALGTGLTTGSFNLTGVQLETGSVATPYERQIYSDQLVQCQRYYYRIKGSDTLTNIGAYGSGVSQTTTTGRAVIPFPVTMRTPPGSLEQSGTGSDYRIIAGSAGSITCSAVPTLSTASVIMGDINWTVASSATVNQGIIFLSNTSASYLGWSAEL
jgi:hypothetical protein